MQCSCSHRLSHGHSGQGPPCIATGSKSERQSPHSPCPEGTATLVSCLHTRHTQPHDPTAPAEGEPLEPGLPAGATWWHLGLTPTGHLGRPSCQGQGCYSRNVSAPSGHLRAGGRSGWRLSMLVSGRPPSPSPSPSATSLQGNPPVQCQAAGCQAAGCQAAEAGAALTASCLQELRSFTCSCHPSFSWRPACVC